MTIKHGGKEADMVKTYLWGGGGAACEVYHYLVDINRIRPTYELVGIVGKDAPEHPEFSRLKFADVSQEGWKERLDPNGCAFITSGYPHVREKMYHEVKEVGLSLPVLCHPSAVVSPDATLGEGCIIGPNCTVSSLVRLSVNVYLSFNASIGHHTQVDEHCFFSPGTRLGARVNCGRLVFTGMNAVVLTTGRIGSGANISACSLVASAVPDGATAIQAKSRIMKLG